MKNKKIFLIVGIVLLALLASITGASWNLSITGQQPGDLLYVGAGGLIDVRHVGNQGQFLTVNNGLPVWTDLPTGNSSGYTPSSNITISINEADDIFYQDILGYHVRRTVDGAILSSSGTSYSAVWSSFVSQVILCYSPSNPNMWSPTNPNGFKEGRNIVNTVPEMICDSTINIVCQDTNINFGKSAVLYSTATIIVKIDSNENSHIHLPLLACGSTTTVMVLVSPTTVAPDDVAFIGNSEIVIDGLVSNNPNIIGVKVDTGNNNTVGTTITVNESNLNASSGICFYIKAPTANPQGSVMSNRFKLLWKNQCSKVLYIENSPYITRNTFDLDMYDGTATITNLSTGDNTIQTNPYPTADPHVRGMWYRNNGVIMVSNG